MATSGIWQNPDLSRINTGNASANLRAGNITQGQYDAIMGPSTPTNNTSNSNNLPWFGWTSTDIKLPKAPVVPAGKFKPVAFQAPNKKNYIINDYGTGWASFIWQDGTLKQYNSLAEAQDYIRQNNADGVDVNYNNAQQLYNNKMAAAGHVTWETVPSTLEMPDTSEMSPEDAAKAMEDYDWRTRMDSLQKSLTGSFDKLWFDNAEFKETVRKNMVSQLAKNQALQDELRANKAAIDAEFSVVKNKFDENTKASLSRIDDLEKTYMAQLNNIKGLQSSYYDTQMQATNDRVAGEQAGLTNRLSAAGVNEFAIGNALGMARTKYNQQFADIKNDNIKVLNDLNNAYKDFANDINKQKNEFNQEDIALLTKKFEYRKDIENAGKIINNDLINATFKPYEDAITAVSTQQSQEMWYESGDKYIAERYNSGTAADRESLLQSKFSALGVSMYGKGDLSKFDMNALKVAASMPNYAEALQYLMNKGTAAAKTTVGADSVIAKYATQKATKPTTPAWAPTSLPEETPETPVKTDTFDITDNKIWTSVDDIENKKWSFFGYQPTAFESLTRTNLLQKSNEADAAYKRETDPLKKEVLKEQWQKASKEFNTYSDSLANKQQSASKSNTLAQIQALKGERDMLIKDIASFKSRKLTANQADSEKRLAAIESKMKTLYSQYK